MADILEFKKPKPLKGFIRNKFVDNLPPVNLAEPIFDPRDSGMPSDSPYDRDGKEPA